MIVPKIRSKLDFSARVFKDKSLIEIKTNLHLAKKSLSHPIENKILNSEDELR